MNKNLSKIREYSFDSELPSGLFDKVILRIEWEKKILAIKNKLIFFSVLFAVSAAISLPLWVSLFKELSQSSFLQYLILPFYDLRAVAASWQDFSLSLLETAPAIILTFSLAALFMLLLSLQLMTKYLKIIKDLTENRLNDKQYGY